MTKEKSSEKELFHVHTFRCKHASDERDELYIKRAFELGATRITFTDHAPFPGNPFGNRMDIESLQEYINTLKTLKERYKTDIDVKIGLEIEYFPSFKDYYKWLYEKGDFDVLLLGQHMYECSNGTYSFSLDKDILRQKEADGLCNAIIEGIATGYFNVVAHPDRIFRKCHVWDSHMEQLACDMIKVCIENNITLERNLASIRKKNQYWKEFWNLVPSSANVITGLDAHSILELK